MRQDDAPAWFDFGSFLAETWGMSRFLFVQSVNLRASCKTG